jgi:hypothetical protein
VLIERFAQTQIAGGEKVIGFISDMVEGKQWLASTQLEWLPDGTGGFFSIPANGLSMIAAMSPRYRLVPIEEGVVCE